MISQDVADILKLLSSREWAIVTWLVLGLVWAVGQSSIRSSFASVLRAALHWKLLVPAGIVALYVLGIVSVYDALDLSYRRLWLDAALWFAYSIYVGGSAITARGDLDLWSKLVKKNLHGFVYIEILVNTYTFHYFVELTIIGVLVVVSIMNAVAGLEKRYKSVENLTEWLLAVFGFALFSYALVRAVDDPNTFRNVETLSAISLPAVLSVGYVPILYVFAVLSHYEQIFIRLDLGIKKSPTFKRKVKWRLFKALGLQENRLRRFVGQSTPLMRMTTLDEVSDYLRTALPRPLDTPDNAPLE